MDENTAYGDDEEQDFDGLYVESLFTEIPDYFQEKDFLFKLDNTLKLRKNTKGITIKEAASHSTIAYTDGREIYIGFNELKNQSTSYDEFLNLVKSINYHELAHTLYTRFKMDNPSVYQQTFNILEDNRIEMLYSYKYPKLKKYFTFLSMKLIAKRENIDSNTFFLLYGRKFLVNNKDARKLLKLSEQMATKEYSESLIIDAKKIIDEYIFETDRAKLKDLVVRFHALFPDVKAISPDLYSLSKNSDTKATNEEKNDSQNAQQESKKDKKQADKDDKKEAEFVSDSDEDTDNNAKSQKDALAQIVSKILETKKEQLKEDIEKMKETMDKYDFSSVQRDISGRNFGEFIPNQKHFLMSRRLQKVFRKMYNDLGNRMEYNQKKGKIDIRRDLMGNTYNLNTFKKFRPSVLNKTRMAVTLYVDASGSMKNYDYEIAMSSAWVISSALEKVGSKTQIIEFSDKFKTIKRFDARTESTKFIRSAAGNTYISEALRFTDSQRKKIETKYGIFNHYHIIVTDGCFSDYNRISDIIKEVRKTSKVFVFKVGNAYDYFSSKNDTTIYDSYKKVTFANLDKEVDAAMVKEQRKIVMGIRR